MFITVHRKGNPIHVNIFQLGEYWVWEGKVTIVVCGREMAIDEDLDYLELAIEAVKR